MKDFCADLKKHITVKFHDFLDSNDDNNNYSNGNNIDEKLAVRTFYSDDNDDYYDYDDASKIGSDKEKNVIKIFPGDAAELNDIDDDYDDVVRNNEFDIRMFHGDATEPDIGHD